MDLRRLRIGELIVGWAGALLIASLFLPWYGFKGTLPAAGIPSFDPGEELTGWEALGLGDLVLLAAGILGLALVVVTATQRTVAIPIALSAIVTLVALVALVVALLKLGSLPDPPASVPKQLAPSVEAERLAGIWVAAVAALIEVVGGMLAMRDERLSRPGRPTDVTGRPAPPPRPIEPVPAPSPDPRPRGQR